MLWKVDADSNQGSVLSLPLEEVSSGLVLEEVDGLDPVEATLVSQGFAQMDGEHYQGSRRETRDITLKIGLEPDYATDTVRGLRKRLYSYFMPKAGTTLRFYHMDEPTIWIHGVVKSFDCPIFVAEPEATIVVRCFDPDFYDPIVVNVPGSTTATEATTPLIYDGSIETGIVFTLNVDRTIGAFSIYLDRPNGTRHEMAFQGNLVAGDVVSISTVPGSKYARVTRAGTLSSVLYAISPQSDWLELLPGENEVRVYAEGAGIPFTIEYTNKYGGL